MTQRPATITLRVQPNARRNEVLKLEEDVLHVRVAAPPVKGKANRELIDFLSRSLGISRDSITIEKGFTSRTKMIAVAGLDRDSILERLGAETKR